MGKSLDHPFLSIITASEYKDSLRDQSMISVAGRLDIIQEEEEKEEMLRCH